MENFLKKYIDQGFWRPRQVNVIDVVLLVLIISAFFYPTKINPWYKIREAHDAARDAYYLAEEARSLAEDAKSELNSHELWYH